MEEAVSALQRAGIAPTDISARNCVWDRSCLTIIDFVDEEVDDDDK